MRSLIKLRTVVAATLGASALLGSALAHASAVVVNLAATEATKTMPDGAVVPMWCYQLSSATVDGAAAPAANVAGGTCLATDWQVGPTIRVTTADTLQINLTNGLAVPTSLTVIGQNGGGLGSPVYDANSGRLAGTKTTTTWPAAGSGIFTVPAQGKRVRSFVPEAPVGGAATAYNWSGLKPGTYLYATGSHPSLQQPMGLYGVLVVTGSDGSAYPLTGVAPAPVYPAVIPAADAVMLFSEVDPVQNQAVQDFVHSSTAPDENKPYVANGCGNDHTCYPPAVNYAPTYTLLNGAPFDRSSPADNAAVAWATANASKGLLVRFVNAGSRTRIPTIVGLQMNLVAEDANRAPGVPKAQSELLLPAGKTFDVLVNPAFDAAAGTFTPKAYPVFDRQLGLSGGNKPNSGGQGYLAIADATAVGFSLNTWLGTTGGVAAAAVATANDDALTISKAALSLQGNVIANDVGVKAVTLPTTTSAGGTLAFDSTNGADGVFVYTPPATGAVADSFTYTVVTPAAGVTYASGGTSATVTINPFADGIATVTLAPDTYTSNVSSLIEVPASRGVLANDLDSGHFKLSVVNPATVASPDCAVVMQADGSFSAARPGVTAGGSCTFSYSAQDVQANASTATASVTVNFPAASGVTLAQVDSKTGLPTGSNDYLWVIEEDRTIHAGVDPNGVVGSTKLGTTTGGTPTLSTSFHASYMPVVAQGCTGPISCGDINGTVKPRSFPNEVFLPQPGGARTFYFVSVLPGDQFGDTPHSIGGAQITPEDISGTAKTVTAYVQQTPLQPAQLSAFIFEDNSPTNGDVDEDEVGLGGFNLVIVDAAGRSGDVAGAITYDIHNKPLTNALLGTPGCPNEENPLTSANAALRSAGKPNGQNNNLVGTIYTCPDGSRNIVGIRVGTDADGAPIVVVQLATPFWPSGRPNPNNSTITISGITNPDYATLNGTWTVCGFGNSGRNITCGGGGGNQNLSFVRFQPDVAALPNTRGTNFVNVGPIAQARDASRYSLAGHALVQNLEPGRYDVIPQPGAARFNNHETWWQVSTLEGTAAQDAFARAGEPSYFQEFGPPGFHTTVGFVNEERVKALQLATGTGASIKGQITGLHMSRPAQVSTYDTAGYDTAGTAQNTGASARVGLAHTNCLVGLNSLGGTGANVAFTHCNEDGTFTLTGIPAGSHQVVVFDQWLDQILAYFAVNVTTADVTAKNTLDMKTLPVFSWFTRIEANVELKDKDGVRSGPAKQLPVFIRYRDGSISNILATDESGNASFNELFPLFNWYVMEIDQTRDAQVCTRAIVDGGGPIDTTNLVATGKGADCTGTGSDASYETKGLLSSKYPTSQAGESTLADYQGQLFFGVQSFVNQTVRTDWVKRKYDVNENGGFGGVVVYKSVRAFDDPSQGVQNMWEPMIPDVGVNIYWKTLAADGSEQLTLVGHGITTSWDDYTKGVERSGGVPYGTAPSCPGQLPAVAGSKDLTVSDPFVAMTLNNETTRCYDGLHNYNQVQPGVYDGFYMVPQASYACDANGRCGIDPVTFQPYVPNSLEMTRAGRYVVEMVVPPGYEVVKEEDKNILIGDGFTDPVAQQFGDLGNMFILPDQATVASAYNLNGPASLTSLLGFGITTPSNAFPKCVGSLHRVPDNLTLFPDAGLAAPFAGADRPLCDRKEVVLYDQSNATANFALFTNTPVSAHYAGLVLDDASAGFNLRAPDFGEKFAMPFVPVSIKDGTGREIAHTYTDEWGAYNGLAPSTWNAAVPNPSGYSPNMLITCMNDPRPQVVAGVTTTDDQYSPEYSNFCYTNPFMPGRTTYLDTPVLPVSAFASNSVSGYNPPDCAYPDATPAIRRVDSSSGKGPWLPAAGGTLTVVALGDQLVSNPAYFGPAAANSQKKISRHYGFGAAAGKVALEWHNSLGAAQSVALPLQGAWSDTSLTVSVTQAAASGLPLCFAGDTNGTRYGRCAELVVTASDGKKSIDTVTVTVGGSAPVQLTSANSVQDAIDAASPGDLLMLDEGMYNELLVMWKPVRLQGVGAPAVVFNAAKYPTEKLDKWRPTINRLFGVDTIAGLVTDTPQVDPLPGQEITGGIVRLEPSVLGTEEGAGITVLAKDPAAVSCFGNGNNPQSSYYSTFDATALNQGSVASVVTTSDARHHLRESNFTCAASRIDGLSVTGGDAGGGIYVNGWAHNLEIANTRVYGNAGAYNGGIRVGIPYLGTASAGEVPSPNGFNGNIRVHNNAVTKNGMVEAPAAAGGTVGGGGAGGGISICTGATGYKVDDNYVCGNFSSGDGGGIGHLGYSDGGEIARNQILFNQAFSQANTVSGGGIIIEGDAPAAGGQSLGSGAVKIDSNLLQGNYAESGHGGGIALLNDSGLTNGAIAITNNMVVNNVAGWSGGGISLQDARNVQIINNTIASNDSVGIAGPLFSAPPANRPDVSRPSPAGVSVIPTNAQLPNPTLDNNIIWKNRSFYAWLTGKNSVTLEAQPAQDVGQGPTYATAHLCPSNNAGSLPTGTADPTATQCPTNPTELAVDPALGYLSTLATGQCGSGASYWDLGIVGDASATPGASKLNPRASVLTSTAGYVGNGNTNSNPSFVGGVVAGDVYCNSSQMLSAVLDEGGNFVDLRYGPLSVAVPAGLTGAGTLYANYHVTAGLAQSRNDAPANDFDSQVRPGTNADVGADQAGVSTGAAGSIAFASATFANLSSPAAASCCTNGLVFGSQNNPNRGQISATVTVQVSGGPIAFPAGNNASLNAITLTGSGSNRFSVTGTTCRGTVAAGQTCTITVSFDAQGNQSRTATLTSHDSNGGTLGTLSLSGT